MKKKQLHILLLLLLILFAPVLFAQHQYIPFPDSNAIWVIRFIGEHGEDEGASQTFIQKDTAINGKNYHKMVETSDSNLITPPGSYEIWYALRNDTSARRVYIYDVLNGGGGQEWLLYDFSVQVGDTISDSALFGYGGSVITDIDTMVIDTNEHLVFYAKSKQGDNLMPYIEGIGGTAGLIYRPWFFEGGSLFVCLMKGENRIPYYTVPGEICKLYHYTGILESSENLPGIKIYPHPLNEHSVITLTSGADRIDQLTIHDMTGKVVLEKAGINSRQFELGQLPFEQGVYFYRLTTKKGKVHSGKILR